MALTLPESWEIALNRLEGATAPPPGALWWQVHAREGRVRVAVYCVTKESTRGKRVDGWGGQHLLDSVMREDDRRAVEALSDQAGGRTMSRVLRELVGHPRVRDEEERPVEVVLGTPSVRVVRADTGACVHIVPSRFDEDGFAIERKEGRFILYEKAPVRRFLEVLGEEGLFVPNAGLPRMLQSLGTSPLPLETAAAPALPGDRRIHVQLFRRNDSLRARLRVMPAGPDGPILVPGVGAPVTFGFAEGGLARFDRDLLDENRRFAEVFWKCPSLGQYARDGADRIMEGLESSLTLLLELGAMGDDIVLDWCAGQPMRVPTGARKQVLVVRAKSRGDYFELQGDLQVGEEQIHRMADLVACASRAVGRFLRVGKDEWIALTADVQKRIEGLERLAELGGEGQLPIALLDAVNDLVDEFDARLTARRDALERARTLKVPVPSALSGALRDYQKEGFRFLARRSEVGLGACLADDMGLGKTIQTLALLLHRQEMGPALVIAPTSVCRNWEDETSKFAPSMRVRRLGPGEPGQVLRARRGDIVVTSYGTMVSRIDLLASRKWGTIVFDEAHALKNEDTQRSRMAKTLRAEACVALTGTPVENHAFELHGLFDVLVPGTLGTREAFDSAFTRPIARGDREVAAQLGMLVRPFVLRRTKGEVLKELPPRTEVVHRVRASPDHAALYEAVRRRAYEVLRGPPSEKNMIFAALLRLRRAAIDPRLIAGPNAPEGPKIEALVEIVRELKAEGRRALVFSQFLEVLDFAGTRLREEGFRFRRLDGTMPPSVRAAEVSAFQAGKGDVFLMSLKAGGVGINLTAADVVILLDPWWNPAVEDQATSRAHRMGQKRVVTVYRVVTEATVEERILDLHATKRQLYEDVVSCADGTGKLDIETLRRLVA